jgi:cell wall-associated NlpC family hydrolase
MLTQLSELGRSGQPTPGDLIEAARLYINTPFRHQGRNRRGLDCLGLLVCAARDIGMPIADNLQYGRAPDYKTMRAGIMDHFNPVRRDQVRIGDVYWMKFNRKGNPMHLALITEQDQIMHADGSTSIKKVCEIRFPEQWHSHVAFSLRWRGW